MATGRGGDAADVVVGAVRTYLEDADYRIGVERGLAAMEAGETIDWTDAERELRA